jgi:outer membrane immunogenic protein
LEADVSWLDARASAAHSAPDPNMPGSPITNSTFQSKLDWLATIRGRAGILFGRALLYATGGLAFGSVENKVTAAIPAYDYAPPAWTGRRSQWGWAAGGGVEYALTQNISLKAEYLYYDLGKRTIRASDPSTFPASEHIDYALSNSGNIARAGVNFRF